MYLTLWWITDYNPSTDEVTTQGGDYPIKNLNFSPQTDLTGNSLPINEYTCDVITENMYGGVTTDAITHELRDDLDRLWAGWQIYKAIRISDTCVRVTCRSWLNELDYIQMPETVYEGETAQTVIGTIFPNSILWEMANALKSVQISGYAPAQTARERLTWVLFVIGGFVRDIYADRVQILKTDTTEKMIPLDRTFMRPSTNKADWVTGLRIVTYSFFEAASDEEAAEYDNSYMFPLPWVATENTVTITNSLAPEDAPENIIEIDGIYLVNPNNVSAIATRLALYWFNPLEASLDCINNRQYHPGDLVTGYTSREDLLTGYVQQESFKFGKQARSTLKLIGCLQVPSALLTVNYKHSGRLLVKDEFRLPIGFGYEITTRYIDQTRKGRRRIYRPITDTITGTMPDGGASVDVACEIALDLYEGVLTVLIVDEVTEQSSGGETIGVIG